ncbi:exportin-4 [Elysia marginata]|uniref:Exportin-4 n=1 Tax=Elysia marginata TaxID=1093978 RepID=A0AAV4HKE8_9GAST|nr:exportin-4 [Elysia marginata]
MGEASTHGMWSCEEKQKHIDILELKAALLGIQSLCQTMRNCHLRIEIDNTMAVAYINDMGGTHSTSYVREQILQTVAVILKRATLDKKGKSCDTLFEDVTTLISSGNITMQLVACSMLTSLLNEYSYTSRTSSVGLTWEFHIKCKREFELSDLKRVFMFSLKVLNEIEAQPNPLSREATAFLNRILCIAEQVLSWEFTLPGAKVHGHAFSTNPNASLKPPESWRDVLLEKSTLSLFFRIQDAIYAAESQYLSQFIEGLLHMLSQIELQDHENFGVACIFKNLLMMFPVQDFNLLDVTLFKSFIEALTTLTCKIGQSAAQEESLHKDDTIYMESYEKLLETWMALIRNVDSLPPGSLCASATQVFNLYMQCHLAAPEGIRYTNQDDNEEDIEETEEDDRYKFADQLCCIGALGRLIPQHSLPLLSKVLQERVAQMSSQLQSFQQRRELVSSHEATMDMSSFHALHEDIHWIVLVAGNLLADSAEGETPTIPSNLMKFSIERAKAVDIPLTMKMLASPADKLDPSLEDKVDSVIRLISAVFGLCEVGNRAVSAKLTEFLSPQVDSTLMWFLERWSDAYMLHDEMDYTEMSLPLATAFGLDTEGVRWTFNFILQKIFTTLSVWTSEPVLISDTLELLTDMAEQSSRATYLSQSDVLWNLARLESSHEPPVSSLAPEARRQFMKAMVLAGCGIKDSAREEQYWNLLLHSNHERFRHLAESAAFKEGEESARQQFLYLLESLIGIATATQHSIAKDMFQFMGPILEHVVKAIDLHHNYADVITTSFELFSEVVAKMLPYLNTADSQMLYRLCLSAIQMFAKHNIGRQCVSIEDEKETKFKDIILIMEMLSNLMSKDILDFNKEELEAEEGGIDGPTVVTFGLELIVPLMSTEMLKFPVLCSCYFRLVSYMADLHSEKFCQLPEPLFNSIMASVEHGFNSHSTDTVALCYGAVASLADYKELQGSSELRPLNAQSAQRLQATLAHFLKVVFRMLVLENFDLALQEIGSTTLFCLICCNQPLYRDLVNELIHSQPDEYKQRLLAAFNELTPPTLNMHIARNNKVTFRANFDVFLNSVRGFLCVR